MTCVGEICIDGAETGGEGLDEAAGLSSIAKASRVLRALAGVRGGEAGVTDLAARAGLPKSTTHRVLSELIGEGLVGRSGQRYVLGPGWFALQSALSSSEWMQLADHARRPLATVFEQSGATIHFGVLDGDQVLYLEKLTAKGGTSVPTRVGGRMPATCTALGKSLLAYADPEQLRAILVKPLPRPAAASICMPRLLIQQLEQIRARGVAYDLEESQPGVSCVAAPVYHGRRVVAAVSLTRVGARVVSEDDVRQVRIAARSITEWLPIEEHSAQLERVQLERPLGRIAG